MNHMEPRWTTRGLGHGPANRRYHRHPDDGGDGHRHSPPPGCVINVPFARWLSFLSLVLGTAPPASGRLLRPSTNANATTIISSTAITQSTKLEKAAKRATYTTQRTEEFTRMERSHRETTRDSTGRLASPVATNKPTKGRSEVPQAEAYT